MRISLFTGALLLEFFKLKSLTSSNFNLPSSNQPHRNSNTKQICWKIDQISRLSEGYGLGSLRAKFAVDKGPSTPAPVLIQLHCANSTFSGINFELLTSAYRVSVVKKQVSAGKRSFQVLSLKKFDFVR